MFSAIQNELVAQRRSQASQLTPPLQLDVTQHTVTLVFRVFRLDWRRRRRREADRTHYYSVYVSSEEVFTSSWSSSGLKLVAQDEVDAKNKEKIEVGMAFHLRWVYGV